MSIRIPRINSSKIKIWACSSKELLPRLRTQRVSADLHRQVARSHGVRKMAGYVGLISKIPLMSAADYLKNTAVRTRELVGRVMSG